MSPIRALIDRIRQRLRPAAAAAPVTALDRERIKRLLAQIENTQDDEFNCDETMRSLDEYVDRILAGEPRSKLMPLVRHHLERCGACNDACAMLLRMLEEAPAA